jgi:hypothetical protein
MILTKKEIEFNQEIDTLAQHVKFVINRISEAGAINDPSRLDAKDNGEKLVHRLQSAARIGGRKRINVFGDSAENSKFPIKQWTIQPKKSKSATPAADGIDGIVNGNGVGVNALSREEDLESLLQEECRNGERETINDLDKVDGTTET